MVRTRMRWTRTHAFARARYTRTRTLLTRSRTECRGYGTVPAVALIAAGLLGIDAAASECESPFDRRPNHLQQESFVAAALDNILQLVSQTEEIKAAGGCVALEEPRCL